MSSNDRYESKYWKGEISYDEARVEYNSVAGSPYLHGGEIIVDLIYYNDSIIKDIAILYDLYNNEIIAKTEDDKTIVLDQIYYKGFTYSGNGEKEVYTRAHPTENELYKILFQNEAFIFCQKLKTSIQKETRHVPGLDLKDKKFVHRESYYIVKEKTANKVTLKKEELISYLPWEYQQQVKGIKKELGIKKLKKEKDYIMVMKAFVE